MSLLEGFLNLLFPPKCPFCGKVLDHAGICPACETSLPRTDDLHTIREGPGALRCAAPLWYEDQVREGILRFKFQGAAGAAVPLGELIARCAAEQFSGAFDTVTGAIKILPISREVMTDVNVYTADGNFAGVERMQVYSVSGGRVIEL